MSSYPGGKKPADQCTYREMLDRFNWEIRRAIREDYSDIIERHLDNKTAFIKQYGEMNPTETIGQFDARRKDIL